MGAIKKDWWWAPAWSGPLAISTETAPPCMTEPQFYSLECFYGADQCGSMQLPGQTSCPATPTPAPPAGGFYYCPI